ncbi:MAG TPA: zf-HC2 domain-containing protein [Thermoleophilaceae bacterium]|nr:zf-HC2 domain-containing protein [Thermoleophilaceae bacterium]
MPFRSRIEHRWARRHLSDYIDDDLAPVQRRRIERHAHGCSECAPLLRSLSLVVDVLRRLPRPQRRSVVPAVIGRLRREPDRERRAPGR